MASTQNRITTRAEAYADEKDTEFTNWLGHLDRHVSRRIGLSVFDLADQPFRDWFDSGMTPDEGAKAALENEGME